MSLFETIHSFLSKSIITIISIRVASVFFTITFSVFSYFANYILNKNMLIIQKYVILSKKLDRLIKCKKTLLLFINQNPFKTNQSHIQSTLLRIWSWYLILCNRTIMRFLKILDIHIYHFSIKFTLSSLFIFSNEDHFLKYKTHAIFSPGDDYTGLNLI